MGADLLPVSRIAAENARRAELFERGIANLSPDEAAELERLDLAFYYRTRRAHLREDARRIDARIREQMTGAPR